MLPQWFKREIGFQFLYGHDVAVYLGTGGYRSTETVDVRIGNERVATTWGLKFNPGDSEVFSYFYKGEWHLSSLSEKDKQTELAPMPCIYCKLENGLQFQVNVTEVLGILNGWRDLNALLRGAKLDPKTMVNRLGQMVTAGGKTFQLTEGVRLFIDYQGTRKIMLTAFTSYNWRGNGAPIPAEEIVKILTGKNPDSMARLRAQIMERTVQVQELAESLRKHGQVSVVHVNGTSIVSGGRRYLAQVLNAIDYPQQEWFLFADSVQES